MKAQDIHLFTFQLDLNLIRKTLSSSSYSYTREILSTLSLHNYAWHSDREIENQFGGIRVSSSVTLAAASKRLKLNSNYMLADGRIYNPLIIKSNERSKMWFILFRSSSILIIEYLLEFYYRDISLNYVLDIYLLKSFNKSMFLIS